MITSGVCSAACAACSAASRRHLFIGTEEPQVASHHTVTIPESTRQKELAAQNWNHPAGLAVPLITKLMPITEQGDLASELEVVIGLDVG